MLVHRRKISWWWSKVKFFNANFG